MIFRRVNPILLENEAWIRERSHEFYSKHYSVEHHFDEPLSGRNALKDVLYDVSPLAQSVHRDTRKQTHWQRNVFVIISSPLQTNLC